MSRPSPLDFENIRRRDRVACERLVREHYRDVYCMLFRFVKNEQDAADLTQDTFRKVWEKIDSYSGESSFATWLFRIAHNNAMDWHRKRQRTGSKDWREVQSESIEIPEETEVMLVRAVLSGTGTVWFDNIKIEIDEKAEQRRDHSASTQIDQELRAMLKGEIVKEVDIQQDAMVLAYLPTWDHGNVDNIAVANNHGGVRTMLKWKGESTETIGEYRVIVALYARKVTALGVPGQVVIQPIAEAWPERISWTKKPAMSEAKCSIDFNDKTGWKLFEITELCKNNSQALEHGVAIRFEQETVSGSAWCGYEFASREAIGEWKGKRPRVLMIK